jgi:hypothetical protein
VKVRQVLLKYRSLVGVYQGTFHWFGSEHCIKLAGHCRDVLVESTSSQPQSSDSIPPRDAKYKVPLSSIQLAEIYRQKGTQIFCYFQRNLTSAMILSKFTEHFYCFFIHAAYCVLTS